MAKIAGRKKPLHKFLFNIGEEERQWLRKDAFKREMTVSALLREIVKAYIDSQRKPETPA